MQHKKDNIEVGVKRIHPNAKLPVFAHETDACADLHSVLSLVLQLGQKELVPTGLILEIPQGYEGQVRPRSGWAVKHGIMVVNSPGTIDAGYRGEVKVILQNFGSAEFEIRSGDRIAQLAIRPVPSIHFIEKDKLTRSDRGKGGFGSTGKDGSN